MKRKILSLIFSFVSLVLLSCGIFLYPQKITPNNNLIVTSGDVFENTEKVYEKNEIIDSQELIVNGSLPSGYCMRDDYLIYTEDQSFQGLCWAFSSGLALSTAMMKATNEYYDVSEGWLSVAGYKNGYITLPGDGGNITRFNNIIKNYGVVSQSDFPYENSFYATKENINHFYNFYSSYANKNIIDNYSLVYFNNYNLDENLSNKETIMQNMKNHILNHSAIYLGMYWNPLVSMKFNNKTLYYKDPSVLNKTMAHAVTIIGWDDSISITKKSKTYTGAWICLNSYGIKNSYDSIAGDDGIFYIFYEDVAIEDCAGYKYQASTKSLYFSSKITNSNAEFTNQEAGENYGSFTTFSSETLQKNVFYDIDDINLTYSYEISSSTTIDNIQIFRGDEEVTGSFNINHNKTNKAINVTGNDAPLGAYKIVYTLTKNGVTEKDYNVFYLINGTEISSIRPPMNVDNTKYYGNLQNYSNTNNNNNTFVVYLKKASGTSSLTISPSSYSDFSSITSSYDGFNGKDQGDGTWYCSFPYSFTNPNEKITIKMTITTSKGSTRDIIVKLSNYDASDNYYWTTVMYNSDGGKVNIDKRVLIGVNESVEIETPTKAGYVFKGWYTDKALKNKILEQNGKYYLKKENVIQYSSNTVYWNLNFQIFYTKSRVVFLYASWEKTENAFVMLATCGQNGSISPSGNIVVAKNANQKFTFTPNAGYYVYKIFIDGIELNETQKQNAITNGYTFTNVTADHSIYVVFDKIGYILSLYYNNPSYTDTQTKYAPGESISVSNNLSKTGYTFKGWFTDNSFTNKFTGTTMPSYNLSLYAKWEILTFTITSSCNQNGSISPSGITTVNYGTSKKIIFTPNVGCYVSAIKINGTALTGSALTAAKNNGYYNFTNIQGNMAIEVEFAKTVYSISASSNSSGTITPKGNITKTYGQTITFTFIPNVGYEVSRILLDGVYTTYSSTTYTLTVTKNHSLYVEFNIIKLDIVVNKNLGGDIICNKSLTNINYGDSRTFNISLKENYEIKSVSVNGNKVKVSNNSFVVDNITQDLEINVEFKMQSFFKTTLGIGILIGVAGAIVGTMVIVIINISVKKNRKKKLMKNNLSQFNNRFKR